MKRSKIFLSLTTCVLGIAAFAASKAASHFNSISGCTQTSHSKTTGKACATAASGGNTSHPCTHNAVQLYTCSSFGDPLYTKAG